MAFLPNYANVGDVVMSSVNQPMADNLITRWINTPLGPMEIAVKDEVEYWYFEFKQREELIDIENQGKQLFTRFSGAAIQRIFCRNSKDIFGITSTYELLRY